MSAAAAEEHPEAVVEALKQVQRDVTETCQSHFGDSYEKSKEPTLVAVSKYKSAALIRACYDAGQRAFGENYVQELTAKAAEVKIIAI